MENTINVELLEQVKQKIRAVPKALNMSDWMEAAVVAEDHPCGTVGCIAGWTVMFAHPDKTYEDLKLEVDIEQEALRRLGITQTQAERLFFCGNWPSSFRAEMIPLVYYLSDLERPGSACDWQATPGNEAKVAEITARRIDYFIKTNGMDNDALAKA